MSCFFTNDSAFKSFIIDIETTLGAALGTVVAFNAREAVHAWLNGRSVCLLTNNSDLAKTGGVFYIASRVTTFVFEKIFGKKNHAGLEIAKAITVIEAARTVLLPLQLAISFAQGAGVFAAVTFTVSLMNRHIQRD